MMGANFSTALGAVGAAGVGAAMMYLMDPNKGAQRRHHLAEMAGGAMESTGHALRSGAETLAHRAAEAGSALYANIPSAGDVGHTGRLLGRHASGAAESARDTAGDWLESAREYLPHRHTRHERQFSSAATGISAGAALLIGLGAMWLFDPSKGRARRAWIGQKTTRCLNETGDFMRATGRHLRNKTRGYYHETRSAAEHLGEKMGYHPGSVEPESSAQQRVEPGSGDAYRVSSYQGGAPTGI
jgi:hypothetical protein